MKGIALKWNNLNEMKFKESRNELLRILLESIKESESQEVHIR